MILDMLSVLCNCRKMSNMCVKCHSYCVDSKDNTFHACESHHKQGGVVHQLEQQQQQQQQQRKEQEKKKKAAAAVKKAKESSKKGSVKKGSVKKFSTSFTAPDSDSDSDDDDYSNGGNKNSNSAADNNDSGGDSDGDWSDEHAEEYNVEVDQTEAEEPQSYLQQLRRTKALLQDEKLWLISVFGPTVDPNSTLNTVFGSSSDNSSYDNMYSSTATSQRRKVSNTLYKQAYVMVPIMIVNANAYYKALCCIEQLASKVLLAIR
jgi:hypothetical protein